MGMRKNSIKLDYVRPQTEVIVVSMQSGILVVSGVLDTEHNIDYGGVDTEGNLNPSSRRNSDVWEEEVED